MPVPCNSWQPVCWADLQEAAFVAVGGHTLWSQEIELHHLHSAVLQLALEGCARAQLGHDCCGGDGGVPQIGVLQRHGDADTQNMLLCNSLLCSQPAQGLMSSSQPASNQLEAMNLWQHIVCNLTMSMGK